MHGTIIDGVKVPGYPADSGVDVPTHGLASVEDAISTTYAFDAHFQPVVAPALVTGMGEQPRVRKTYDGEAYLCALFVDFDLPAHRRWEDDQEAEDTTQALVDCALRLGLSRPNAYSTGGGARLAWRTLAPVPASDAEHFVRSFHAEFADSLRAGDLRMDPKAGGWTRAYRLARVRRDGAQVTPAYLSVRGEPLSWRPSSPARPSNHQSARVGSAGDFPLPRQLSDYEWALIPHDFRATLRRGSALFPKGQRNEGFFGSGNVLGKLSAAMAEYMPPDAELLFRAVFPCAVACHLPDDIEPDVQQVWDTLAAYADADGTAYQVAAAAGLLKGVPDVLDAFGRAVDARTPPKDLAKLVDDAARGVRHNKNEAKIGAAVERALSDANRPWLVYTGERTMAYFLDADGHYKARARDVAATLLEREHGADLRTDAGGLLPFANVFDRLGVYADEVALYHWTDGAADWYDPAERTLHYVTSRPRTIPQPTRHAGVERWLRELCAHEDEHETLLDWLATYHDVTRPTAALFFHGSAGTGKTLFAEGISALWGPAGKYVQNVGTRFNEGLIRSPVLLADEGLALNSPDKVEAFKELVTRRLHTVDIKNRTLLHVRSCVRVIIGGNDISSLQFLAGGSSYHMDAIAERVVAIECRDTSALLDRLRPQDNGWVLRDEIRREPGKIAEHAAWLRENRQISRPSGRLIVDGKHLTRWRNAQSAASEDVDGGILAALAMWAHRRQFALTGIGINPEQYPGVVLVNAASLRASWAELTQERDVPNARRIAKALAGLSKWPRSRSVLLGASRLCCHAVPVDQIVAAADVAQIGDTDTIRATLAGERVDVAVGRR